MKKKIQQQIENFPENPQFKNYLAIWYGNSGNIEKSFEINKEIVESHPDYLFGKLNLVAEYLQKEMYEKIPDILGEEMEIKALYPNRDLFHIDEVTAFLGLVIKYYIAIDKIHEAELKFEQLQELAPEDEQTKSIRNTLMLTRFGDTLKKILKGDEKKIKVKATGLEKGSKNYAEPVFVNPEVNELYQYGLDIPRTTITKILSLPAETLAKDLELVLKDSVTRFDHLLEPDEDETYFLIHAIFLLGEIRAVKSLENCLSVLTQSEEYVEFYFGDFVTDTLWEPMYKMANNQLEKLKEFMGKPGVYIHAKAEISEVPKQVAFHEPQRKPEVITWFKEVLTFYAQCNPGMNIIDDTTIGLMICQVIDIEAKELLPEIKRLFELGYVAEDVCGTYSDVEKTFKEGLKYDAKNNILSMMDRYEDIISRREGLDGQEEGFFDADYPFENDDPSFGYPQTIIKEPKIGRNDPCPCGSGKKYKKCCLEI